MHRDMSRFTVSQVARLDEMLDAPRKANDVSFAQKVGDAISQVPDTVAAGGELLTLLKEKKFDGLEPAFGMDCRARAVERVLAMSHSEDGHVAEDDLEHFRAYRTRTTGSHSAFRPRKSIEEMQAAAEKAAQKPAGTPILPIVLVVALLGAVLLVWFLGVLK